MPVCPAAEGGCSAAHIIQATILKKNSSGFIFPAKKDKIHNQPQKIIRLASHFRKKTPPAATAN
jgi:hypothetical protein